MALTEQARQIVAGLPDDADSANIRKAILAVRLRLKEEIEAVGMCSVPMASLAARAPVAQAPAAATVQASADGSQSIITYLNQQLESFCQGKLGQQYALMLEVHEAFLAEVDPEQIRGDSVVYDGLNKVGFLAFSNDVVRTITTSTTKVSLASLEDQKVKLLANLKRGCEAEIKEMFNLAIRLRHQQMQKPMMSQDPSQLYFVKMFLDIFIELAGQANNKVIQSALAAIEEEFSRPATYEADIKTMNLMLEMFAWPQGNAGAHVSKAMEQLSQYAMPLMSALLTGDAGQLAMPTAQAAGKLVTGMPIVSGRRVTLGGARSGSSAAANGGGAAAPADLLGGAAGFEPPKQ